MTESSSEPDRSQQEAMKERIESLERRVAELEELERKREREWEAARERWLCVAAAEIDGRWAG
jgi:predicted nuclease with TOPRIM domain